MRKCAHNTGIANMRAGRKINRRQIAIQVHRLFGRSKKRHVNQSGFIFTKKDLPGGRNTNIHTSAILLRWL